MRQYLLGVCIKFDDRAILKFFFKRVVHDRSGLVMLDLNCRRRSRAITGPLDMSCYYILWSLEPFEADHSSSTALRFATLDTALSELIHLLPGYSSFGQLNSVSHCDPNPRIANVSVEFMGIEAMNNPPRFPTQHHNLFCRPQPLAVYAHCQLVINLICAAWRD